MASTTLAPAAGARAGGRKQSIRRQAAVALLLCKCCPATIPQGAYERGTFRLRSAVPVTPLLSSGSAGTHEAVGQAVAAAMRALAACTCARVPQLKHGISYFLVRHIFVIFRNFFTYFIFEKCQGPLSTGVERTGKREEDRETERKGETNTCTVCLVIACALRCSQHPPARFASSAASTKLSRKLTPSGLLGVPVTDTTSSCGGHNR